MTSHPLRRILPLAGLAAAALLASCAQKPPPAPPPPPPAISLSPKLIEDASAFEAYVARTTAISPAFTSAPEVAQGLRTCAAYQPDQLLRGAIAYGAVAALQDQGFVTAVRAYAVDPAQRRQIAYSIMATPAYVTGIAGAASAAGLVTDAIGEDARKLVEHGRLVKQAAYDVQHSDWSKAEVAGRDERLALAKQLATALLAGDVAEASRLRQASVGATQLGITPLPAVTPFTPVVTRSLALAALAALGYGDDANLAQIMPLTAEPTSNKCLQMSKLDLYQCLAVAKPNYEDIFCLGQHGVTDTGSCLMASVGIAPPALPAPPQGLTVSKPPKAKPAKRHVTKRKTH